MSTKTAKKPLFMGYSIGRELTASIDYACERYISRFRVRAPAILLHPDRVAELGTYHSPRWPKISPDEGANRDIIYIEVQPSQDVTQMRLL